MPRIIWDPASAETASGGTLLLNARVQMTPAELEALARETLVRASKATKLQIDIVELQCFSPASTAWWSPRARSTRRNALPSCSATDVGEHAWPAGPIPLPYDSSATLTGGSVIEEPPYRNAAEVVLLIKLALQEGHFRRVETACAVESGVVAEHAVAAVEDHRKRLILRVWPVFFAHPKRIEYKFYVPRPSIQQLVLRYLTLLAAANDAELVEKS